MIQEFINYQRDVKRLSPETIRSYQQHLRAWVSWASTEGLRWSTTTRKDVERYLVSEKERGMSARTLRGRLETLRLIFKYAKHQGLLDSNPAWYVDNAKIVDVLPKAADEEKILTYLESEVHDRESLIIHIIIALIYETGMRIGEVCKLEGQDIDCEQMRIRVHGKGSNERYVFFGNQTIKYLSQLTCVPGKIFRDNEVRIRYMMYNQIGVNPHAIRHTFATRMINKGMALKTLSVILGHKNVTTTEIYAKVATDSVQREYQKFN